MTYNFDAEKWFENQKALLEARRARGELDGEAYRQALEDLERRYERMIERLDGTYRIPK